MPRLIEAVLLDSGNFVIRKRSKKSVVIWQSFDHPKDTWLPGATVAYNRITNEPRQNQTLLLCDQSVVYWNSADWRDSGFLSNNFENGSYFKYLGSPLYDNHISRVVLEATGQLNQLPWVENMKMWKSLWRQTVRSGSECEVYPFCGVSPGCNLGELPICECALENKLDSPPEECTKIMMESLQICNGVVNETLFHLSGTLIGRNPVYFKVKNILACQELCLSDSSCTAYTYVSDLWCITYADKKFIITSDLSKDLYIRFSVSAFEGGKREVKRKPDLIFVVALVRSCFSISSFVVTTLLSIHRQRAHKTNDKSDQSLILFKYSDLRRSTKNFSEKIGECGFGAVFKGALPNSTAIAVKRLHCPTQGEKQFRAEVRTIGSLQHLNLVRLGGFCAEGSKRFLVFDYMSNGSLASHLFHDDFSKTLDWRTRYNIAIGTAKGLAFLHGECRECIIHCDIKPDNILLDTDFQPKIADFGLAKLFSRDASRVLTTIRGTVVYLAPEWISGCPITTKVDVFSYGKVLFEIISGKRNMDLMGSDICNYFPFQVADKIVQGDEILSLLDAKLKGLTDMEQLRRACKVACCCTRDNERDRPTLSQVVNFMEGLQDLPMPPIPRFFQQIVESRLYSSSERRTNFRLF